MLLLRVGDVIELNGRVWIVIHMVCTVGALRSITKPLISQINQPETG